MPAAWPKKKKPVLLEASDHCPSAVCRSPIYVEKVSSQRDLGVLPLPNGVGPMEIRRKSIKFLWELYVQNHYQLGLKGTEPVQNKKRSLDPLSSTGRKQAENITQLLTHDTFPVTAWYLSSHEKGRMTHREKPRAQRAVQSLGVWFPRLET